MTTKKTYKVRDIPTGKTQVNFNLSSDVLDKVKNLAHREGVSNSDIYNRAIERYIEEYEKKQGKLKARPTGQGLI